MTEQLSTSGDKARSVTPTRSCLGVASLNSAPAVRSDGYPLPERSLARTRRSLSCPGGALPPLPKTGQTYQRYVPGESVMLRPVRHPPSVGDTDVWNAARSGRVDGFAVPGDLDRVPRSAHDWAPTAERSARRGTAGSGLRRRERGNARAFRGARIGPGDRACRTPGPLSRGDRAVRSGSNERFAEEQRVRTRLELEAELRSRHAA